MHTRLKRPYRADQGVMPEHNIRRQQEALPSGQGNLVTSADIEIAEHMGLVAVGERRPWWETVRFGRGRFIAGAGAVVGTVAVGGGLYAWGRHQADQLHEAQVSVNDMLDEVIHGMKTNNQFREAAAQCGDPVIDLDLEESLLAGNARSGLRLFEAAFGTSNNFKRGLDGPGKPHEPKPFSQPTSITEIGASSLDQQALDTLRIVEIITRVFAHPGAYSGDGPFPVPGMNIGATDSMISGQLNYTHQDKDGQIDYAFQQELRQTTAKPIMRVEGGYDDYRVLFSSVAQLAGRLSDVKRLATSNNISKDMQHEVETFLAAMGRVADQFGKNLIKFADNLSEANDYRLERGLMRITMETVFTWNFVRQRYFPFSAIDGDNSPLLNNPLLGGMMLADPTGPDNLGRYLLDTRALAGGIGPKLAYIAWGLIVERQIQALRVIEKNHPKLHRVVTDLIDMNKLPDFYTAEVYAPADATATADAAGEGGSPELTDKSGHPGGVHGKLDGADRIALRGLEGRQRKVKGEKRTTGDFSSLRHQPAA